jgi:hypothetical protein
MATTGQGRFEMILIIIAIAVTIGAFGPGWMAQISDWREAHARQVHTSYAGTISSVRASTDPDVIELTMANASVGHAYSVGSQLSGLELDEVSSVTLKAPRVDQMLEYLEGWMETQEPVRIEIVRDGRKVLMFTANDELGRGIAQTRSEFLDWGTRPAG